MKLAAACSTMACMACRKQRVANLACRTQQLAVRSSYMYLWCCTAGSLHNMAAFKHVSYAKVCKKHLEINGKSLTTGARQLAGAACSLQHWLQT
jgi:hypothetical protein